MKTVELKTIDLELEHEMLRLSEQVKFTNHAIIKLATHEVIDQMRSELESLLVQVSNHEISVHNLGSYLLNQKDFINLSMFESHFNSEMEFDNFKHDLLLIVGKAIMNTYFNSIFQNAKSYEKNKSSNFAF